MDKLNILWTNADPITSEKMVMMYSINSKLQNWWSDVTIIVWGATTKLLAENEMIQEKAKMALHSGVKLIACKSCADQLRVTEKLESLGIEIRYMGEDLTEILKKDGKLLSI